MGDIRIGLVAPYKKLVSEAKKISKKKGVCLWAIYAAIEEAIATARKMEAEGIDVIVAREGTDSIIKEHINIPVVPIKIGSMEVLKAILKAGEVKETLVLGNFRGIHKDIATLEKVLGREILEFKFETRTELNNKINKLNSERHAIVGGGLTCDIAGEHGFRTILVESSEEWIEYALDNAYKVAWSKLDEKQKRIQLLTIVNETEEGIIAIDIHKKITVFNTVSEQIFKIPGHDVLGKYNDFVLKKTGLLKAITNNNEYESIESINDKNVIIHSVPIKLDGINFGGVCSIHEADKVQKMEEDIRFSLHARGLTAKNFTFDDILGNHDSIVETIEKAKKFSATDFTILITGESGTGKELFAHSIVNESKRKKGPFIAINCAAIPPNLLEAELFGYEEGSFTGAKKGGKPGYFEIVHNGTIFLDEIGKLNFDVQGRLLRVIEQKEVIKVGGNQVIPVNVRVIAATNENLGEKVAEGSFREDLYYRLNVLHLYVPPLRDRIEDLYPITLHILDTFHVSEYNKKIITLALREFSNYPWKGNVRELSNVLTQLVVLMGEGNTLSFGVVKAMLREIIYGVKQDKFETKETEGKTRTWKRVKPADEETEAEILTSLLKEKNMNMGQLAKSIGVSRSTLWRKLKKYNLA